MTIIRLVFASLLTLVLLPFTAQAETSSNDFCIDALPITVGTATGSTLGATWDRSTSCDTSLSPDVWFLYEGPTTERLFVESSGSFDTVISIHNSCSLTSSDERACNNDTFDSDAVVELDSTFNFRTYIRVSGTAIDEAGDFQLRIGGPGSVSGRITNSVGEPLVGITVTLATDSDFGFSYPYRTTTDSAGRYVISEVVPDKYRAFTENDLGYLDEHHEGGICDPVIHLGPGCDLSGTQAFEVRVEEHTESIDFSLEKGGMITGIIRGRESEERLAGVFVAAYEGSRLSDQTLTEEDGSYRLHGLSAGAYHVLANAETHADQVYPQVDCSFPHCLLEDRERATPVAVEVGQERDGIDFDLPQRASISGRVLQTVDGAPAENVQVLAFLPDQGLIAGTRTDAEGRYQIGGLVPNDYQIQTDSFLYFNEIYPNHACERVFCWDEVGGEPVGVGQDQAVSDVDFELDRLGTIRGRVTDAATGEPIAGVEVPGVADFDRLLTVLTDSNGEYLWEGLEPEAVLVSTLNVAGFIDEVYDDVSCPFNQCDTDEATLVEIEPNSQVENIDFALERGGTIRGQVTDAATGLPLLAFVDLYDAAGKNLHALVSTDAEGFFEVTGLASGRYFVGISGFGFGRELYDGLSCNFGCDPRNGTPVDVLAGEVTDGINVQLRRFGSMSGRVIDRVTGEPIQGLTVQLWDSGGFALIQARTDAQGRFQWSGLDPIAYHVSIPETQDYQGQVFDGVPCPEDSCDPTSGEQILVPLGKAVTGINFALESPTVSCQPNANTLCLNDGRFRVTTRWSSNGIFHPANAVQLTDDSGYFWFFNQDNVELMVKLLDGCSLLSGHYWFFAGGLTDVATSITVTDTWTGARKHYGKDRGEPFASILDTTAFDTCDATMPRTAAFERANAWSRFDLTGAEPLSPPVGEGTLGLLESCSPGPETLCLNQGRFQVEALWNSPTGDQGVGQGIQLTEESGYFWFFNDDNVEVVIKVLDGCAEPQNAYWVFSAGLTNVEVILRVTDTTTGDVRRYVNPQGQVFEPIQDTRAFTVCP